MVSPSAADPPVGGHRARVPPYVRTLEVSPQKQREAAPLADALRGGPSEPAPDEGETLRARRTVGAFVVAAATVIWWPAFTIDA